MSCEPTPAVTAMTPETLDPIRFPLHGSRLIEASAGTGKTFTIAALYVRLVIGHGEHLAFTRALPPPEILVVTFTDAATQELRDRIRARLTEAALYFRQDPGSIKHQPAGKDFLYDLRADYPSEEWPSCARKLQLAAEWMDEAAVSTIHGWCNRMLREHAFDSDSLFTQQLETDQSELFSEVVRDYWRTFMVPLNTDGVTEVLKWWAGPEGLQANLNALVQHVDLLAEAPLPAKALQDALAKKKQRLEELKAPWATWVDELQELLDEAREKKEFNRQKLKKIHYDEWLKSLATWRDDPHCTNPGLSDACTKRLTVGGLADIWKGAPSPQHDALTAIASLNSALSKLPDARKDLLRHAARWVADRFATEQARRAQMGFNDLLTRLEAVLLGPNGGRLADTIRRQFPVALIDEFQDTDPVQFRIFDAVYRVKMNDPDTAIILIGDPKQAIYAFRGADIHTYLDARQAAADRLYTLKKNFRSTEAMVAASNRCFAMAEAQPMGKGAFLFRSEQGNPIPFVSAVAEGRKDVLQADGVNLPALTAWWLPPTDDGKTLSKEHYFEQMAEGCASEMVRLLKLGQDARAGFVKDLQMTALRPADMAVLVNNAKEAEAIRRALARRGVRSVYLSDKESVFQTGQATDMQHWLAACAEPDDGRLLRAALATATIGLSWAELDHLNHNEHAWEERVLQFRGYREYWRVQGVLPMLRRLLNDFAIPTRLLRTGDDAPTSGERILTDVLHLAELMQEASIMLDGEHALIRYLAEQRQQGNVGTGGDAPKIRLESDADLVQVVTVHKSKGLEYPLVFLPFVCNYRKTKADDLPLKYHDDDGKLQLALANDEGVLDQVDQERLGEDLRKLYVALTRARYATWIGLAPIDALERSAIGYLLSGGEVIAPQALEAALQALAGTCKDISVLPAPAGTNDSIRLNDPHSQNGFAREMNRTVREHWWIASYSALKSTYHDDNAAHQTPPETSAESVFLEANEEHEDQVLPAATPRRVQGVLQPSIGPLHDLPRGATPGTFLHDLLEWAAVVGFAKLSARPELLRDMIARRCNLRGWEQWIEPLTVWLTHFLSTPVHLPSMGGIPATLIVLSELQAVNAEMEFWLAAHEVEAREIDRLVCAHTLEGDSRPALRTGQLSGMLKGFIDLVFEHEGRYYVADYKSNWLGPDDAAYTSAAMRATILHARYELQYVLYLLALHRLLKSRLPDYDYDRHMGGAVYFFLRGLQAPSQGLHTERPPRELIESLDALFVGSSVKEIA